MKVLLNGVSGSLGPYIAEALSREHYVHPSSLDITNRDIVIAEAKLFKPDVIVHVAAMVRSDVCASMPEDAGQVNVMGTGNVAMAADAVHAKLVYFSTSDVYKVGQAYITESSEVDAGVHVYAQTKYEGEIVARHYVPDATILRPGMTFGAMARDNSKLSEVITSHWTKRWTYVLMNPKLDKDYTSAANVAEIVRLVLAKGAWGELYNTGSGEARTWNQIERYLVNDVLIKPYMKYRPEKDYLGARVFSTDKIRKDLGWESVQTFAECVADVYAAAGRRHAAGI